MKQAQIAIVAATLLLLLYELQLQRYMERTSVAAEWREDEKER